MKRIISFALIGIILITSGCTAATTDATTAESNTYTVTDTTLQDVTTSTTVKSSTTSEKQSKSEKSNKISAETKSTEKSAVKTSTSTVQTKSKLTSNQITCTIEISCKTIINNKSQLKSNKLPYVPSNGIILDTYTFTTDKDSTVFDVLKKVCNSKKIQLEYTYSPGYDSYYVEGIHQLYEKDCGTMSGWMYSVNDVFPNYGCNSYKIKNGDKIKWLYTCDLGEDLGA